MGRAARLAHVSEAADGDRPQKAGGPLLQSGSLGVLIRVQPMMEDVAMSVGQIVRYAG